MHDPGKVLLLLFLLTASFTSNCQDDSLALSEEYFNMGMEVYDFYHRKQARELFVLSTDMNPDNAIAQFMAGKSILLTVHKEESLPHFLKAWQLDPEIDEEIIYFIGKAYQYSEKFDSAIMFYEQYNRILARSMKFQKSLTINSVNHRIFECRNAQIYMSYPVDVEITNMGDNINSEWPDYAPAISADETIMVFTSRRPDGNVNPTLAEDKEYYEDIYISNKIDGVWHYAKNIGTNLNTEYHDASINLSPDGKQLYLYSDNNGGDIYISNMQEDGTWSPPVSLKGEVNSEYLENSVSITADGQFLFFSSDRPRGYGGTDIYVATKNKNGAWIKPVNLGPIINTDLDEEGVFISASGDNIYFSSNGHAGMGDLDIYRSTYNSESGLWEEPLNLGFPINTVENDIFFALTGDERYAYYSSVKKGGEGEQEIYRVNMQNWESVDLTQPVLVKAWLRDDEEKLKDATQPVKVETKPVADVIVGSILDLEITVVDEISLEPISARVVLISENDRVFSPENLSNGGYGFHLKNDDSVKYTLRITSEGYLPHMSEFRVTSNSPLNKITETIILNKARKHFTAVLNVYFGLDSDIPNTFEDIQYMEILMRETPTIKIEISGYTDSSGPLEYNKDLSKRRANAVRKYLIDAGIPEEKIEARGYGEENPVADNSTRAGRRLNRRTEFKILEE